MVCRRCCVRAWVVGYRRSALDHAVGLGLRLQVGDLGQKLENFIEVTREEFRELRQEMNHNQAQLIELVTNRVGKNPDAS